MVLLPALFLPVLPKYLLEWPDSISIVQALTLIITGLILLKLVIKHRDDLTIEKTSHYKGSSFHAAIHIVLRSFFLISYEWFFRGCILVSCVYIFGTAQAIVINGMLPHALKQFRVPVQADVLFLDPPYASDLVEKTLKDIGECSLLGPRGVVVWQNATRRPVPVLAAGFSLWQSRCYGNTQLSFYTLDTRL